jgi:phosphoribosylformimino-5-aminoimidazole carboxamide ribotide isomerase
MDLYARINILDGRAVRLPRGNVADAIPLDADPVARAQSWAEQGADRLHVVDLDAAAYGDMRNRPLIDQLLEETDIDVQVAGGIRSHIEAKRLIDAGAWRIVMGTAAIESQNMVWELCRDHPGRIAVSLDVRPDEEIATRGWTQNSGRYLEEVLIEMASAGVSAFLIAETGRDVLTSAPDPGILRSAMGSVDEPIIAAGGVSNLEHLETLLNLGTPDRRLDGVIVGREVTAGRFSMADAKKLIARGARVVFTPSAGEKDVSVSRLAPLAKQLQELADECERAAAHARTAADRMLEGDLDAGLAQSFSSQGHLRHAQDLLEDLSKHHSDYAGRRK